MKIQTETNSTFYKSLFTLALPIIIHHFLISSLNFLDTLMIGQLSETAIAAVGIANQINMIFIVIQYGINSGMSIFTSQYWGSQDKRNVKRILGLSIVMGVSIAVMYTILTQAIPHLLFRAFTADEAVIASGVGYLRIISVISILNALSFSYSFSMKATGNSTVPMLISMSALFVNGIFNYILIFGKFGFPELGVIGAAISTAFARTLECVLFVSIVHIRKYTQKARLNQLFGFSLKFIKQVFNTTLPVFIHEFLWICGVSVYNLVYARIGTEAIAAVSIAVTVEHIGFVLCFGMTEAGAILTGNKIGEKDEKRAFENGKKLLFIEGSLALVTGILIILLRNVIISFYNIEEMTIRFARNILLVIGLVFALKVSNFALIVGIFRGGGDTRVSFFIDAGGVWLIGVPMALIGGFVFHLPVYFVMSLVVIEEFVKLSIALPRFFSKRWINNLISSATHAVGQKS